MIFRRDRRAEASPDAEGLDSTASSELTGEARGHDRTGGDRYDPFASAETEAPEQGESPQRPLMLELWLDAENAEAVPYSEITRVSRHRDRLLTLHCPAFMIEIEGTGLGVLWDDLLAGTAELIRLTRGSPSVTAIKLIPLTDMPADDPELS